MYFLVWLFPLMCVLICRQGSRSRRFCKASTRSVPSRLCFCRTRLQHQWWRLHWYINLYPTQQRRITSFDSSRQQCTQYIHLQYKHLSKFTTSQQQQQSVHEPWPRTHPLSQQSRECLYNRAYWALFQSWPHRADALEAVCYTSRGAGIAHVQLWICKSFWQCRLYISVRKIICSSISFWIIFLYMQGWIGFTLLSEMPSYLTDILGFDLGRAGLLCVFPYLALLFSTLLFARLFDYLQREKKWEVSRVRRVAMYVAYLGSGAGLVVCCFVQEKYTAYGFMVIAQVN